MAYSLAASQDLIRSLDTKEHRRMEMRGTTRTVLREYPTSLTSLMTAAAEKRTGSESFASSPVQEYEQKAEESVGPDVAVRERNADLESGR
jgi:hypothetical protein